MKYRFRPKRLIFLLLFIAMFIITNKILTGIMQPNTIIKELYVLSITISIHLLIFALIVLIPQIIIWILQALGFEIKTDWIEFISCIWDE